MRQTIKTLIKAFLVLPFLALHGCFSAPSIDGNWYASIPYEEDGLDLMMDVTLAFGIDTETEGELTGDIQLSGQGETDEGDFEATASVDLIGKWRLEEDRLYMTLKKFSVNIDPDNVSYTPNITSEEGLMAAFGPEILNSVLGGFTGFSLPIDRIRDVGKQYIVRQIESEINKELRDLKGQEYYLGTIVLERKSLTIRTSEDGEDLLPGDNGELVFYKF